MGQKSRTGELPAETRWASLPFPPAPDEAGHCHDTARVRRAAAPGAVGVPRCGLPSEPVREPHPPIYVGGGAASFPRIADVGDGWLALPFHDIGPMLKQLREKAGWDVPVTVLDIHHDPAKLAEYAEADAERVLLELPTMPEAGSLRELDRCAELVAGLS